MIKIIIIFLLALNVTGCNVTYKNLEINQNNFEKEISSEFATYLNAKYYISKGDVYTASEILNKAIDSSKLLKLKISTFPLKYKKVAIRADKKPIKDKKRYNLSLCLSL